MRVRGSRISSWLASLVWLVFRKWNTGMGAKLAGCHRVPQLSYRYPARKEVLGSYPLARWYSPFPVDSDEVLGALGVGSFSLDVVIPERDVQL